MNRNTHLTATIDTVITFIGVRILIATNATIWKGPAFRYRFAIFTFAIHPARVLGVIANDLHPIANDIRIELSGTLANLIGKVENSCARHIVALIGICSMKLGL